MKYKVQFSCMSHIGKYRSMNQDNYSINGSWLKVNEDPVIYPVTGYVNFENRNIIGIFDGMGGEQCGEVAALIAAEEAAGITIGKEPINDLLRFCKVANDRICSYQEEKGISAMGTTAAVLAFAKKEIALCNIGDSKIFRYAGGTLEQLSVDHYGASVHGRKPPLSQNLGIPPDLFVIEPHVARGKYNIGDIFLLCSDGLTDMVGLSSIKEILSGIPFEKATESLVDAALSNGGKDNITVILCRIESNKKTPFIKAKIK